MRSLFRRRPKPEGASTDKPVIDADRAAELETQKTKTAKAVGRANDTIRMLEAQARAARGGR